MLGRRNKDVLIAMRIIVNLERECPEKGDSETGKSRRSKSASKAGGEGSPRAHLQVQVLARRSVLHLGLEERASAHFDVHHVRIPETGQQVLQFDERLPVVLDFPVILGHDVLETGLVGQRLVHVALRAAAALFPYCAQTGRGETVRMSG